MTRSTRRAWRAFEVAFRPFLARHLRVHVTGLDRKVPDGQPLLVCANHVSWWDGFLLRDLQRRIRPRASFHAIMLERELQARPFLRRLGGIGVEPGSIAAGRALLSALEDLPNEGGGPVVAYFPQGTIRPSAAEPLGFRPGVSRIVDALGPTTVLPVGLRLVPGRTHRMEALLSVGTPLHHPGPDRITPALVESAVREQLDAVEAFLVAHGEDTAERWPAPFEALPRAADAAWNVNQVGTWISRN